MLELMIIVYICILLVKNCLLFCYRRLCSQQCRTCCFCISKYITYAELALLGMSLRRPYACCSNHATSIQHMAAKNCFFFSPGWPNKTPHHKEVTAQDMTCQKWVVACS